MASHYHSDHSGSSAQSAEQTGTGSLPRSQPRSLTDGFIVSQNRTRIPSSYGPLGQSTGFSTAAALLAAEESGTSSTHDAEVPINYSPSTNVGPALSASRDAGDRTTLRIYREPFVIRPDTSFIPSNVETSEVRGYITRAASEISPNLQNLTDTFDSLASESSVSGGRSRVVSSGLITTSNRDFSSSSSNSQGALGPAQALEQFNIYARQQGLTVIEDDIEDEETGKIIHCISFFVKIVSLISSVETNQHPQLKPQLKTPKPPPKPPPKPLPKPLYPKIVQFDFSKNRARAPRWPYPPSQKL